MHADAMDKPGGSVNKPSFFPPVIAFLEMQFTPRAIHPLQVHSTRVFSVGTELDNHHHPQCRGDPRPISSHPRFPAPASLRQLLTFQSLGFARSRHFTSMDFYAMWSSVSASCA